MHSHIQLYITHTPTYIDKLTLRLKELKLEIFDIFLLYNRPPTFFSIHSKALDRQSE